MSDWERVPLSVRQLNYAALDAWAGREVLLAIEGLVGGTLPPKFICSLPAHEEAAQVREATAARRRAKRGDKRRERAAREENGAAAAAAVAAAVGAEFLPAAQYGCGLDMLHGGGGPEAYGYEAGQLAAHMGGMPALWGPPAFSCAQPPPLPPALRLQLRAAAPGALYREVCPVLRPSPQSKRASHACHVERARARCGPGKGGSGWASACRVSLAPCPRPSLPALQTCRSSCRTATALFGLMRRVAARRWALKPLPLA